LGATDKKSEEDKKDIQQREGDKIGLERARKEAESSNQKQQWHGSYNKLNTSDLLLLQQLKALCQWARMAWWAHISCYRNVMQGFKSGPNCLLHIVQSNQQWLKVFWTHVGSFSHFQKVSCIALAGAYWTSMFITNWIPLGSSYSVTSSLQVGKSTGMSRFLSCNMLYVVIWWYQMWHGGKAHEIPMVTCYICRWCVNYKAASATWTVNPFSN